LVDVDLRRNAATSGFKGLVKFHGASIDVPDGRMDRIPPTCSGLRHFLMVRRANSILYPITVMNPRNRLHFRDRLGSPPFAKNRQCVIRRKSMLETRVGLLATTEVWSSHRVGEPPRSSSARYISTHDVPRLETASERPWP
jgi:hypothetical protein